MKQLFEEAVLGRIPVKNRLVRSATLENGGDDQGRYSPAMTALYDTLAQGGVGLIITGMVAVDESSGLNSHMIRAYDSSFVQGLHDLAGLVHRHGTKLVVQLAHCGANARYLIPGHTLMAPSRLEGRDCQEMTRSDIQALTARFAEAARRCQQAGADGVQIHGAHGYLLSQFLCPHLNRRTDEYGGPIEHRARIVLEVYRAIRAAVGPSYPVWIKINSSDFLEDGLTLEESTWVCRQLSDLGVDAIEVSGGVALSRESRIIRRVRSEADEGYFLSGAIAVSQQVTADVISVGGYRTPAVMEHALNQGNIQAISLCRSLVCEPDLPSRWKAGDHAVSRCVGCYQCLKQKPLHCATVSAT